MKRSLLLIAALLAACGEPAEAPEPVTEASAAPLLGDAHYAGDCTAEDRRENDQMHQWGRIAAASTAFEQCMATAMTQQVTWTRPASPAFFGGNAGFGPYQSCSSDPFVNEAPAEQLRRALQAARSANDMRVRCEGSEANAHVEPDHNHGWGHGNLERYTWGDWFRAVTSRPTCDANGQPAGCLLPDDPWPYSQAAGIIWHEAFHTHGYRHFGNGDDDNDDARCDCGRENTPGWHFQVNTMPYIVGNCVELVLSQSGYACDMDSCGQDELELVDGLGSGACECVTDPKEADFSRAWIRAEMLGPRFDDEVYRFYAPGYVGFDMPLTGVEGEATTVRFSLAGANLPDPVQLTWVIERANGSRSAPVTTDVFEADLWFDDRVEVHLASTAAYPDGYLPELDYAFVMSTVADPDLVQPEGAVDLAQTVAMGGLVDTAYEDDGLAHTDLTLLARATCNDRWDLTCTLGIAVRGPEQRERTWWGTQTGQIRAWVVDFLEPGLYEWWAFEQMNGFEVDTQHSLNAADFEVAPARYHEPPVPPAAPIGTGHFLHPNDDLVTLRAVSYDLNGDDLFFLFEVRRWDEDFDDQATHWSSLVRSPDEGDRSLHARAEIALPFDGQEHHWQVRVLAAGSESPWVYGGYYPDRGDIMMARLAGVDLGKVFDNPHRVRERLERDFREFFDPELHRIFELSDVARAAGLFFQRRPVGVVAQLANERLILPVGASGLALETPRGYLEEVLENTRIVEGRDHRPK